MLEPLRLFLTHPFGLSLIGLAAVSSGLLAAWLKSRNPSRTTGQLVGRAAAPLPLVCALATIILFLLQPWNDPLIVAVLLTVGVLGTIVSALVGAVASWLVLLGIRT